MASVFYLNTVAFTFMLYGLAGRSFAPRMRAFDKILGELAYPVFLLQWLAGLVTHSCFFPRPRADGRSRLRPRP